MVKPQLEADQAVLLLVHVGSIHHQSIGKDMVDILGELGKRWTKKSFPISPKISAIS